MLFDSVYETLVNIGLPPPVVALLVIQAYANYLLWNETQKTQDKLEECLKVKREEK